MTEMILLDLEKRVNNNYFKSKDQLVAYINEMRQNKQLDREKFDKKVEELLSLYDKYNESELPLNLENDKAPKTNSNYSEKSQEFKEVQNTIIANNNDGTNADAVFDYMAKYQKESYVLMPLSNLNMQIINKDMLDKIRFFVKNGNINIFDYQVDISNGLFFNIITNELFEVTRDPDTQQFKIYKENESQYNNKIRSDNKGNDIANLSNEESLKYQSRNNNSKVRVLRLNPLKDNRAAFTKTSFLIIILFLFSIMCALLLLLLK